MDADWELQRTHHGEIDVRVRQANRLVLVASVNTRGQVTWWQRRLSCKAVTSEALTAARKLVG